jgi:hypothetical protein
LLLAVAGPVRADDEAARKVIDKAIKAHGGAKKLAKFKAVTFKMKGKFYVMSEDGTDYTGEWSIQSPDKIKVEISGEAGGATFKFVQVVNGNKGWIQLMDTTQEMDKDALAEAKETFYADRVRNLEALRGKGFKLEPLGEAKVGGREAVGVKVSHKGHRDVNLFFDKKTNLLLKAERRAKDPMAGTEFTQADLYDDYKEVEGIQHARKLTILRDDKKFLTGVLSDLKPLEKLDNDVFAKP